MAIKISKDSISEEPKSILTRYVFTVLRALNPFGLGSLNASLGAQLRTWVLQFEVDFDWTCEKVGSLAGIWFWILNRYASKGARFQAPCSTEALWLDLVVSLYIYDRRFGPLSFSASAAGSIWSRNPGTDYKKFVFFFFLLDQGWIFDAMIWVFGCLFFWF